MSKSRHTEAQMIGTLKQVEAGRKAEELREMRNLGESKGRVALRYGTGFVSSTAALIATGWSEPVPGRELHPLKSSAFSRRTRNRDLD